MKKTSKVTRKSASKATSKKKVSKPRPKKVEKLRPKKVTKTDVKTSEPKIYKTSAEPKTPAVADVKDDVVEVEPKPRRKRARKSSKKALSILSRSGLHVRDFELENGETHAASARFYCNIIQRPAIRSTCAVGLCGESGCPFFRNEEDQDIMMEYMDDQGKTRTLVAEIVRDKHGNRKLNVTI